MKKNIANTITLIIGLALLGTGLYLLKTVFDGSPVKTVVIDPLGSTIPPGPEFYPALIRSLGEALSACR